MALKKLEFSVKQRKDELCNMLSKTEFSKRRKEQLLAAFDAQLEYIALEPKLQVLKNELHSAKQLEADRQQVLQTGIEQVKKNIVLLNIVIYCIFSNFLIIFHITKINNIEHYIHSMETVLQNKALTLKRTYNCVEELLPYTEDMSWCDLLRKKLNHEELRIFQQFPYGYNNLLNTFII
nr:unnamed protein product [Callosobruchus analis]